MRRAVLPGSTAMTLRSSMVPWHPRMFCTWCVSKLTCSLGLVRFNSSKIHCLAAPMASGALGSEHVLRVLKLESFCSSCCRRSSDTDATSFSIRGSIVCACTGARISRSASAPPHTILIRTCCTVPILTWFQSPSSVVVCGRPFHREGTEDTGTHRDRTHLKLTTVWAPACGRRREERKHAYTNRTADSPTRIRVLFLLTPRAKRGAQTDPVLSSTLCASPCPLCLCGEAGSVKP